MISENLRGISADTGLVCLLLATELGRSTSLFTIDTLLLTLTLIVVSTVPFFLSRGTASVGRWAGSRLFIAAIGLLIGASLGDSGRFVPMSMLIFVAFVSCAIQFYSLFKLRPAD